MIIKVFIIIVITTLLSTFLILSGCRKENNQGRSDREIDYYFKGSVINKNSGLSVDNMTVECWDESWEFQKTIDSVSRNGTYMVYYHTSSDPHTYHLHNVFIKAYNRNFFGDTFIDKSLFKTDTLFLDLLVNPVGNILLTFHNLTNLQKVIFSVFDKTLLGGKARNSHYIEFIPLTSDTTFLLQAYPDRENRLSCLFYEYSGVEKVLDSLVTIKSGDTIILNINH